MTHLIHGFADFCLKLPGCLLLLLAYSLVFSSTSPAAQVLVRVSAGNDDSEEQNPTPGSMYRTSTDLELGYDGNTRQIIGIRFQNINVPSGVTINSAYLQFATDELDSGTTDVVIYGEAADNPSEYSSNNGDITVNRTKTSAFTTWSIPAWNTIGETHDSPDLTAIIQEIVNRIGWAQNNSAAFIIEPAASCNSSACQRTAESYNGSTSSAPQLVIEYDSSGLTGEKLILSTTGDATLGGLSFNDDDLAEYDLLNNLATNYIDGTVLFNAGEDIDAAHILDNGHIVLSTLDDANIGGISMGDDDLVEYDPNTDTATIIFDGGNIFSNTSEDIDAVFVKDDGDIILSVSGSATIGSLSFSDEDLVEYDPNSGIATLFFDGSTVYDDDEDTSAVHIDSDGNILLSTKDNATINGTDFGDDDIVEYNPTSGTAAILFNGGSLFSNTSEDIDAITSAVDAAASATLNADWHLDELAWSGTTGEVADGSGNNFNGTALNGAVTSSADPAIAGSPGTCNYGEFDGVDQKLEGPYDADLNPDSFTVTFWARVDGGSGTFRSPFTSRWEETDSSVRRGYNVYAGFDNNWQFWTGEGIASWDVLTGPAVVEGAWTHIAVTFEVSSTTGGIHTGTKMLYVDGSAVARKTADYQPNISDPLYIGAGGTLGTQFFFNGATDEMRVYDQALDQTAIAAIMVETRDCAAQSSLAEWRLDEASWDGTAGEVVDSSGNSNHGVTLTGVQATTAGQVCGAADIPSNSTDSEQEAIDTGVDVDDEIGDKGTISLWYKSNADWIAGDDRALFDASLSPYYFYLVLQSNGALLFGLEDRNDLDVRIDSGAQRIGADTWVHVAVTWDYAADSFEIFVNGSLVARDNTNTNGLIAEFDTLYLGDNRSTYHFGGTGNSADGTIDEWLVFQQVLSASDISSIYKNQLAGNNSDGTARVCPTVSDVAFGFNCVESSLDALTGNLYTKTVGQSFGFDVVALKDSDNDGAADAVEPEYAGSTDRTVTVELIDTSPSAACSAYPALSPAVSQSLMFTASDAGRKATAAMSTNVAYRSVGCRVTDNTDTANPVVGCSTDWFAARPTAMTVSSNMTNSGSTGAPTAKAGSNFTMTATATAGYDGTPILDSSKREAHAGASQTGVISGAFGAADSATGIATAANFTYDEVGNFRYLAEGVFDSSFTAIDQASGDCTDDFSNALVGGKVGCKFGNTSATDYFGRFVPDHFTLSGGFITNRIDRACTALSNFTYMDEYFQAVFSLSARNLAGTITQNYAGAYAKIDPTAPSNFDFTAMNIDSGVTNLTGRLIIRGSTGTWLNGIAGNLTADLAVSRLTNPDGAYAAVNVGINPVDSDSVALNSFDLDEDLDTVNDHAAVGQNGVRYGRLNIANAYGSELLTLPVPLTAQYYSSSGIGFVTNTDDSCTAMAVGNLTLSNNVETGQTDGDIDIQTSPGITTQATIANAILTGGDAGLTFCPPGNPACTPAAGNSGYVDIEVTAPSYLQFDWFGTGLANPKARASFGLFEGRRSQIFMREVY